MPMPRIVVMGVAGCGKTTVGRLLAERLAATYVDADDAHPAANVAKMSAGLPLDDDDRRPWLDRLAGELAAGGPVVVSCSALKRAYRDRLRRVGAVRFVFLDIEASVARARLAARTGHFMGPALVASQFAALDPPGDDEDDVVTLGGTLPIDRLVDAALASLEAS